MAGCPAATSNCGCRTCRAIRPCPAFCIEVSDTRGERRPPGPGEITVPDGGSDSGRGLLIVEALADRWAVFDRNPGKTVRAELDLLC